MWVGGCVFAVYLFTQKKTEHPDSVIVVGYIRIFFKILSKLSDFIRLLLAVWRADNAVESALTSRLQESKELDDALFRRRRERPSRMHILLPRLAGELSCGLGRAESSKITVQGSNCGT